MGTSSTPASSVHSDGARAFRLTTAMWLLLLAYTAVSAVMLGAAPLHPVLALIVTSVGLALIHGSMRYGLKGVLVFLLLFLLVGFSVENAGMADRKSTRLNSSHQLK